MFEDIAKASIHLKGFLNHTPVMTSRTLNKRVGAEVYLKCENFQRAGSFKYRGVSNAVSQLTYEQKQKGVFAFSSGNHSLALAQVGDKNNIKVINLMPNSIPQIRKDCVESYHGEVLYFDPLNDDLESLIKEYQESRGYTMIPPFNNHDVICGQGTAIYELMREIPDIDTVVIQCGGGGLLSGSAIAAKGMNPKCNVIGVEPELANDAQRSFYSGTLHSVPNADTIAFGLRVPSLGTLTFPIIQQNVDEMVTVSEESIISATRFLLYRMKLVAEPSGAVGLAALLSEVIKPEGKIGIIISGGNIDDLTMTKILNYTNDL